MDEGYRTPPIGPGVPTDPETASTNPAGPDRPALRPITPHLLLAMGAVNNAAMVSAMLEQLQATCQLLGWDASVGIAASMGRVTNRLQAELVEAIEHTFGAEVIPPDLRSPPSSAVEPSRIWTPGGDL
jgi:hypothetical protein